jgi:hypothetical protein
MNQGRHLYMQTNEARNAVVHYLARSGLVVEGANSVLLTPDNRFLFAANVGDNSVSSFRVADNASLKPLDVKRTGNIVSGTLSVLHTDGPSHIPLMSVDDEGMLAACPEGYCASPADKPTGSRRCSRSHRTSDFSSSAAGSTSCPPGIQAAAPFSGCSGTVGRT